MLLSLQVSAQTLDVTFNTSEYKGGYNISCYGASDGRLEAIIIGGTPPYSFQWSNGAFTKIIDGLTAGTYSITVTDSLHATVSKSYTLMGPDAMTGSLSVSTYNGGYNVSAQGADDGWITTEIGGGAPPYTYQWSNGAETENNHELTSGAYSVVVRDVNQCQLQLSASLTQPTPLHVVSITSPLHNGYNVSCKGGEDGAVNLTVSGGVPPYNFQWNNGNFTEDIQNLNAGVYSVKVKDANSVTVDASITLNQPGAIEVSLTAPTLLQRQRDHHGHRRGDAVHLFLEHRSEHPEPLQPHGRHLLGAGYGCQRLHQTRRRTMTGNGGIDSSSEFLGTTDSTSLILKTNNAERIRIRGAGGVAIQSGLVVDSLNIQQNLSLGGRRLMGYRTSSQNGVGLFGFGQDPDESISSITSCSNPVLNVPTNYQFQGSLQLYGNFSAGSGIGVMEMGFDGTNSFIDVVGAPQTPNSNRLLVNYYCGRDAFICTGPNGGNVQLGGTNSNIGIGIDPSTIQVSNEFRLYVAHGIRTEKLRVDLQGNWPDYVFDTTYRLMKLHQLKEYINRNKRLPGIPSAFEIKNEGVDVGDMQCRLLTKIEELTLYLLEQQNEINELKKALSAKSSNK